MNQLFEGLDTRNKPEVTINCLWASKVVHGLSIATKMYDLE